MARNVIFVTGVDNEFILKWKKEREKDSLLTTPLFFEMSCVAGSSLQLGSSDTVRLNPLSLTSDLDRISPYTISIISSRQLMRIKKNINKGIIG